LGLKEVDGKNEVYYSRWTVPLKIILVNRFLHKKNPPKNFDFKFIGRYWLVSLILTGIRLFIVRFVPAGNTKVIKKAALGQLYKWLPLILTRKIITAGRKQTSLEDFFYIWRSGKIFSSLLVNLKQFLVVDAIAKDSGVRSALFCNFVAALECVSLVTIENLQIYWLPV
jgi:hypothetical protein